MIVLNLRTAYLSLATPPGLVAALPITESCCNDLSDDKLENLTNNGNKEE